VPGGACAADQVNPDGDIGTRKTSQVIRGTGGPGEMVTIHAEIGAVYIVGEGCKRIKKMLLRGRIMLEDRRYQWWLDGGRCGQKM